MLLSGLSFALRDIVPVHRIADSSTTTLLNILVRGTGVIDRVVEDDTVKVMPNCVEKTVRLIGINTAETVDSKSLVQCSVPEASAYVKTLLTGKKVRMTSDATQ
jgi:endonuclease YncB( thermonuclease family)